MQLKIVVIDGSGRPFFSPLPSLELFAFSSNPHVLDAHFSPSTSTLQLHGRRDGRALFLIKSRAHPELAYFNTISVGSPLLPGSDLTIHVGGNVQFKPSALAVFQNSEWRSSNSEVLSID